MGHTFKTGSMASRRGNSPHLETVFNYEVGGRGGGPDWP